jgi:hypothetical protein
MKQCPTCRQPFAYDLLKFCRFDGARLVSVAPDEAITMRFPTAQKNRPPRPPVSARRDKTPRK